MAKVNVRKGMPSVQLDKQEFKKRFLARFYDPEYEPLARELDKVIETAWITYDEYHKSPRTRKAGKAFGSKFRYADRMVTDTRKRAGRIHPENLNRVTHPDRQRSCARPELPRRNVKNLADGHIGKAGDREDARLRS
jgi:hypothetical protein